MICSADGLSQTFSSDIVTSKPPHKGMDIAMLPLNYIDKNRRTGFDLQVIPYGPLIYTQTLFSAKVGIKNVCNSCKFALNSYTQHV